ncbi:hypothetical protein [Bifidobacterium choerinum]|uniref:hypothetical protein n=1 Tax=Bifidobacterium choerinum TaxID=35760 RepID=UPI003F935FB5
MKIRKRDTRKQTESGDSNGSGGAEDKQPQCSKCGKKLPATDTKGICKHCEAKVEGHWAAILGAVAVVGSAAVKYGPKVVSGAMKVIKK